jgi:DNA/RNA-binding domain of Phe-tRNA-synthetase-like protein
MSAAGPDEEPFDGAVDSGLAEELPGLRLRWTVVDGWTGKTSRALKRRLGDVSTRFRGANAIQLRTRPVPRAYRVFFRQVGLDPDVDRTPVEQAAVERLIRGDLHTGDRIADALVLALIETGVPVVAFDESLLRGDVVLRAARAGETLPAVGGYAHDVPHGRLILADDAGPVSVLFGRLSEHHAPGRACTRIRLVAVAVPGVPAAHVDEALWLAATGVCDDGA